MWTAFPSSDYYDRSVAMGLAARRRSRVRSDRTSERDVGPLFVPLNDLAGRRSAGGVSGGESETALSCRPRPYMPWRGMCVSIAGDWGSSNPALAISRGPCGALGLACSPEPPLHRHALVPIGFRHKVKTVDPEASLPASPACGRDSTRRFSRRTVAPHTAQASAAGEEIPCRPEHPILVSPYERLSVFLCSGASPGLDLCNLVGHDHVMVLLRPQA